METQTQSEIEDNIRLRILDDYKDLMPDQEAELEYLLTLNEVELKKRWREWAAVMPDWWHHYLTG